jgi:hypothetical protein
MIVILYSNSFDRKDLTFVDSHTHYCPLSLFLGAKVRDMGPELVCQLQFSRAL